MADTSVSYKCPNCGAPLSFLPGHDHVTCEYCNTELDVATVENLFQKAQEKAARAAEAKESKWKTDGAGGEWDSAEAEAMKIQTCSSCGAELVSDGNTMATECAPSGSSKIRKQSGDVRYAMMPVWILTTNYQGKPYTFMMNGQTGKVIGSLPIDKRKATLYPLAASLISVPILYFIAKFILGSI